jgi:hypothetical protein
MKMDVFGLERAQRYHSHRGRVFYQKFLTSQIIYILLPFKTHPLMHTFFFCC